MSNKLKQDISIGKNLKSLRLKNNLTQEQVAIKLQTMGFNNISREIISQMEAGRYSIRISILVALKDLYKVSSYDSFFEKIDTKIEEE